MSPHRLYSPANLPARFAPCSAHRLPPSPSRPHLDVVTPPSRFAAPTPRPHPLPLLPFARSSRRPKLPCSLLFSLPFSPRRSHCSLRLSFPPLPGQLLPSRLPPPLHPRCRRRSQLARTVVAPPPSLYFFHPFLFLLLPEPIFLASFYVPLLIKNSELGAQDCSILNEMDLFHGARVVRLRSHLDKFLIAKDDLDNVCQDRRGDSYRARWTVELVEGSPSLLRLKSCYGRYLTASNKSFFLGVAGRKVLQSAATRLDSSVEWEPIREGSQVMLKTHDGRFLRANGGLPPLRNSVTHNTPHYSITPTWLLWNVIALPPPSTAPSSDPPLQPDRASGSPLPSDVSEVSLSNIRVL